MRRLSRLLASNLLTLIAALTAACFIIAGRVPLQSIRHAVDWALLCVLFSIILSVDLLGRSGVLEHLVQASVQRFHSTRKFALALLMFTGLLSAVITNDVALFVVIPFTVAAARISRFDARTLVMLEITAANLIGCLTPLGNPQNLFVYHASGATVATFLSWMLPFVLWSVAGLTAATSVLIPRTAIHAEDVAPVQVHPGLAFAGSLCFFAVLLEIFRLLPAWPVGLFSAIVGVIALRQSILKTDFSIVPLFLFVFIIVAGLQSVGSGMLSGGAPTDAILFMSGLGLSQLISNVPATILLAPMAGDRWRLLLYAVSAAGCGTLIASLANLIGWQIYRRESGSDRHYVRDFTLLSFGFLVWSAAGSWLILSFSR